MIIDTHTHLNDSRYEDGGASIIRNLKKDGIESVICVGYDHDSSKKAVKLAEENEAVYAAVGIHPHDSKYAKVESYEYFERAATKDKVVAIGEIGLDYYYDHSPRDVQQRVFVEQMEIAHNANLPIIIHLRDAYGDMLQVLQQNKKLVQNSGVVHCYSGSLEFAQIMIKMGLYLSFGGAITYKNNVTAPRVIQGVDFDRVMLETDCPYLTPVPYRGQLNEPKYTSLVAQKIAEIKGIEYQEVVDTTTKNAKTLFTRIK